MKHGGDYVTYLEKYNKMPLDYSENTSPLDMPEGIKNAIITSLDYARRYPDPLNRRLRKKICQHIKSVYDAEISEDEIICGNGAADLIFRICLAKKPKKALIMAPTFAEYEEALRLVNADIEYYSLQEDDYFKIDSKLIDKIKSDVHHYDMIFICQPNNPTGVLTDKELLMELLDVCKEVNSLLVVDECFMEFVDNFKEISLFSEVCEFDNLFILKAFTKLYSMAGVRLGYGVTSDRELLKSIRSSGQPWAVSVMAEFAGMRAVEETDYVSRVRDIVKEQRQEIKNFLREMDIYFIDGEANYILFYINDIELEFSKRMYENGVMIRDCSNYMGLQRGWYRIAVKNEEENKKMLEIFKRCYRGEDYDS